MSGSELARISRSQGGSALCGAAGTRGALGRLALFALWLAGCADSSGGGPTSGSGGASGTAGNGVSLGGSAMSGGASGTAGDGVSLGGSAMSGGAMSGGATSGGATTSSGGEGSGGSAGAAGAASTGGSGGGTTAGAGSGDAYVSELKIVPHSKVAMMLTVTWTQTKAADQTFLEFSFENGAAQRSRPKPGATGAHQDTVIGAPEKTVVTVRVVSSVGGVEHETSDHLATTGAAPSGFPVGQVLAYDPTIASPERYMLGAVEDSIGGKAGTCCYWSRTWWTYIVDRKGRLVWFYADPSRNPTSSFPRKARDGDYLFMEKRPFSTGGSRSVFKLTLDYSYTEDIPVADLSDAVDMTSSGSLLYDANYELRELSKAGVVRTIWSCPSKFGQGFQCYSNTVNWNPAADTVYLSFPEENTIVEIDRATGALVGQYGKASGSYAFSPAWNFEYQHFANVTASGTLMVSSHMPGYTREGGPVAGKHAFIELEVDRTSKTLLQKWIYNESPEFAHSRGMAIRLPSGNTLGNYGPQGVIREVTPDKKTAFHVKFDVDAPDDFFNKMVGHNDLLDDLYSLNGGPAK